MIESLFPADPARAARRLGTLALMLAVFTYFLFPASAVAGTETETLRASTTAALAVAGLALRLLRPRPLHHGGALALLAAAGLALGATWLVVFAVGATAYLLMSLFPRGEEKDAAAPSHAPARDPLAEGVRENVEAVAMALVLALTVREFAFEAFVIPTGSMEPTILGVGTDEDGRKHQGDRLLASKIPLLFGDPPRWSIVVFRFPLYRPTNFIKRLVGLPGETVVIRDGDIYVNGVIEPKPDVVQESLWFPYFPGGNGAADGDMSRHFEADGSDEWTVAEDGAACVASADRSSWLSMDAFPRHPRPHDFRISFDATVGDLSAEGGVLALVEGGGRRVTLEIGASSAFITAPGMERTAIDVPPLPLGHATRVGLGVADRVIRVTLDGRQVAKLAHPDVTNLGETGARVALGLRGGRAAFSGIRVDADLHYEGSSSWNVPPDHFVMLGDNTTNSRDSRKWDCHEIVDRNGRSYIADGNVKLDDGSSFRNFRSDGDDWVFLDSHGIARRIPKEGAKTSTTERPFVHRDDLIGRAFFTFFPFPPFGEFRPRFLP